MHVRDHPLGAGELLVDVSLRAQEVVVEGREGLGLALELLGPEIRYLVLQFQDSAAHAAVLSVESYEDEHEEKRHARVKGEKDGFH